MPSGVFGPAGVDRIFELKLAGFQGSNINSLSSPEHLSHRAKGVCVREGVSIRNEKISRLPFLESPGEVVHPKPATCFPGGSRGVA